MGRIIKVLSIDKLHEFISAFDDLGLYTNTIIIPIEKDVYNSVILPFITDEMKGGKSYNQISKIDSNNVIQSIWMLGYSIHFIERLE